MKSSKSVTLSAFVHTPTLPASANVLSSTSKSLLPLKETVNSGPANSTRSLRTPDTVELGWTQRGENEPEVGAWKEGLRGGEFLAEINEHCIVGRRAQAMEPHG